jgi:NADP-dependent 3-hydroxy acid dehydrogenase YdfG
MLQFCGIKIKKMSQKLKDKVALVTGGNSGIGWQLPNYLPQKAQRWPLQAVIW